MPDDMGHRVHEAMRARDTDDLLRIWVENDREEWSDQAFEAVRAVLAERGVDLPTQESPPSAEPAPVLREQPEEMVSIATFPSAVAASIAKSTLDGEGIPAAVFGDILWRTDGPGAGLFYPSLHVRRTDAARAMEVLGLETPTRAPDAAPSPVPRGAGGADSGHAPRRRPAPEVLVTVERYVTSTEAHLARGLLESEGVWAVLFGDSLEGAASARADENWIRLRVRGSDLERAREILGIETPVTELLEASAPAGRGTEPEAASAPAGRGTEPEAASAPAGRGTEPEAAAPPAGRGTEPDQSPAPDGIGAGQPMARRPWWRRW